MRCCWISQRIAERTDYTGRLWDVLSIAVFAAIRAIKNPKTDAVHFEVIVHTTDQPRGEALQALWMTIGPGDTEAPVLTIMLEGED